MICHFVEARWDIPDFEFGRSSRCPRKSINRKDLRAIFVLATRPALACDLLFQMPVEGV